MDVHVKYHVNPSSVLADKVGPPPLKYIGYTIKGGKSTILTPM
jgi:hypothetical protein